MYLNSQLNIFDTEIVYQHLNSRTIKDVPIILPLASLKTQHNTLITKACKKLKISESSVTWSSVFIDDYHSFRSLESSYIHLRQEIPKELNIVVPLETTTLSTTPTIKQHTKTIDILIHIPSYVRSDMNYQCIDNLSHYQTMFDRYLSYIRKKYKASSHNIQLYDLLILELEKAITSFNANNSVETLANVLNILIDLYVLSMSKIAKLYQNKHDFDYSILVLHKNNFNSYLILILWYIFRAYYSQAYEHDPAYIQDICINFADKMLSNNQNNNIILDKALLSLQRLKGNNDNVDSSITLDDIMQIVENILLPFTTNIKEIVNNPVYIKHKLVLEPHIEVKIDDLGGYYPSMPIKSKSVKFQIVENKKVQPSYYEATLSAIINYAIRTCKYISRNTIFDEEVDRHKERIGEKTVIWYVTMKIHVFVILYFYTNIISNAQTNITVLIKLSNSILNTINAITKLCNSHPNHDKYFLWRASW